MQTQRMSEVRPLVEKRLELIDEIARVQTEKNECEAHIKTALIETQNLELLSVSWALVHRAVGLDERRPK